jgi:hypothetical protein
MNLIVWTIISASSGAMAMGSAALYAQGTPWLYMLTVGSLGCTLALVQGRLLPLRHERRDWMIYGLLAAVGGMAVLWGADWYVDDLVGGLGYGAVVGIMGWAIIRDSVPGAWRWIVLNMFGYMFVAICVLLTKYAFALTGGAALPLALLTTAAVGYSYLSGEGLRRLVYNNGE